MVRSETDEMLRRLANYLECQLSEVFQRLLAESRSRDAQGLCYTGLGFVTDLREVIGAEGGDE